MVKRLHSTPWPTCVAMGPGQASATAQPTPKITLPTTWLRCGASRAQATGSPVSSARARARRSSQSPRLEVATAETKKR
jgi:hypothetical protein